METIEDIIQSLLGSLDRLHTITYGAATSALGRASEDLSAAPVALVLAFALGMVHALMPGHGKSVVFSYFLGSGARLMTGIGMATKIAALHVGVAAFLLLVIGTAVVRLGRLQGGGRVLEFGSYATVALMGAWLLYRSLLRRKNHDASHQHHHDRPGILPYAVGLLPCPLTIILLNYALVNETLLGGLVLVAVMAIGIAVTMALTGMSAIFVRRSLIAGFSPASAWFQRGTHALEVTGAGAILAIGFVSLLRMF